jgi:hypothetical protein
VNRPTLRMRFARSRGSNGIASVVLLLTGFFCLAAAPQNSPTSTSASNPTITFTLDFPESDPAHYSISVDAAGHAVYECTAKLQEDSEEQAYKADFNLSTASRERIFDWAKQAKYFSGKIDSGNQKLAFTGEKILSYQDGKQSFTARYNYSSLEPVRELTTLFQNIAATQDYGRRLSYYHRYQKLALDEELKRMETQARNNELSEIQGVAPVLEEIVGDTAVINVVRGRAKAIIQMGSAPTVR